MKKKQHPVALITGASRGIGSAMADAFAAAQYDLILTGYHHTDVLAAHAESLQKKYGVQVEAVCCDAANPDAVEKLFEAILRLDLLINNAGISWIGLTQDMTPAEWNQLIAVNLSAYFYTARLAIPKMLSQGSGRIINISSVWGAAGASTEVAYSAAKGGVNAMTKALAKELAPSHIPVNAIACGFINTEMNAGFSQTDRNLIRQEIPADRFGAPEEVAQVALALANTTDYLTGQIITLDGGWI